MGGSTMSPVTPSTISGTRTAATTGGMTSSRYTPTGSGSPMSAGAAGGQGGRVVSSSVSAPAGAAVGSRTVVGHASPGGMARIPEGEQRQTV